MLYVLKLSSGTGYFKLKVMQTSHKVHFILKLSLGSVQFSSVQLSSGFQQKTKIKTKI